jgi:hypothetical protein
MQCEEFEDRINTVLDQRSRPEWNDELRLHLETCAECRALTAAYGAALDGFYTLCAAQAPPADLAERVLADLRPRPATAPRVALVAAILATAAGLAIALLPTIEPVPQVAQLEQPAERPAAPAGEAVPSEPAPALANKAPEQLAQPTVEAPAVADTAVSPPVPATAPAETASAADPDKAADPARLASANRPRRALVLPKWLRLKRGAGNAGKSNDDPYADLMKETGRGLASLVLAVPGVGGRRGILEPQPANAEPAWAAGVSDSIRPVTDSVTETFNILLRTIAVSDPASRS